MASSLTRSDISAVEELKRDEDMPHVEEKGSPSLPDDIGFDEKFEKRTVRKVDIRLLPVLGSIFAFSLIDSINLPSILVTGAGKDIGLNVGNHYSLATLAFFIPFILLEMPSNVILRRVGASRFLSATGGIWGITMICMGFVKNSSQLIGLRAILGIVESGFHPACLWLISSWYKRSEVQVRMAAFFSIATFIVSFSGIMAYSFSTIKVARMSGWRWILIIEGIITCALSIAGYFLIVDFPDKNKILTQEETALIIERLNRDRGDTEFDVLTVKKALTYACDLKLWSFGVATLCAATVILRAAYAYGYFSTMIVISFGYSVKNAQLLVALTSVTGCLIALFLSKLADKWQTRAPFVVLQSVMVITGLCLTAFHQNTHVRYLGCFSGVAGVQANLFTLFAYQSNNIRGQSKRAFASALQVGLHGAGGIVASAVFRQQDAPAYKFGIKFVIALQALLVVLMGLNSLWFAHCNRQAHKGLRIIEGLPGFLYTL